MRDAETVLAVIRERGKRGLPLEDLYRQLYNPNLYLRAYGRIYGNDGAMTAGITAETADGMSRRKIQASIEVLRNERYRWTPVRRIHIEKKNSMKLRPLGIPTWSDKLLQEVIRSILEAYYEPQLSPCSHGFRPNRGCHTALTQIQQCWTGTVWFIEGDIKGCFDNIDHAILLSILRERIHDNRFLRLIANLLEAGYLEDWKYNATLSGTPQGSIVSPILANIYLDRLDKFVEQVLLPRYNQGKQRRDNPAYRTVTGRVYRARLQGRYEDAVQERKQLRHMPSGDPDDPSYRRLHYIRYADDFLLGFAGPKAEAEEIKRQVGEYLRDELKLELCEDKTLITHARTEAARFLGYEIVSLHDDAKCARGKRSINGRIGLKVPRGAVEAGCARYMKRGRPAHRPELENDSDYSIVAQYQQVYRGIVQYYVLAYNVCRLAKLRWVMETSLAKTLAMKHKTTVQKVFDKHKTSIQRPEGTYKVLQVTVERGEGRKPLVARFGGIPLRRRKVAELVDAIPRSGTSNVGTELLQRLLADTCELCGSTRNVEVHHVRKLADLNQKGRPEKPLWIRAMAARRRKTLMVCDKCHDDIHARRPHHGMEHRRAG